MRSLLTVPFALLLALVVLSISSTSKAIAINLDPRQLIGDSGLLGGVFADGASAAATTSDTATTSSGSATTSSATTASTAETTTTSTTSSRTTSTTPRSTSTPTVTTPSTTSTPTTSSTSEQTTESTSSPEPTTSLPPLVVTTVVTRTSSGKTFEETATSTGASASASASNSASLSQGSKSSSSSGLSDQSKKTIIGVVCGIGGAIILAALGVLAYRIWGRKRDDDEDDLYDPNSGSPLANDEKSRNAALASDANPFKRTLDQYHNPGPVNTASNF